MNRTVHRRNVDKSNAAYISQKTELPLVIFLAILLYTPHVLIEF